MRRPTVGKMQVEHASFSDSPALRILCDRLGRSNSESMHFLGKHNMGGVSEKDTPSDVETLKLCEPWDGRETGF